MHEKTKTKEIEKKREADFCKKVDFVKSIFLVFISKKCNLVLINTQGGRVLNKTLV